MLEGVTYQSKKRFEASLYALEVKSRFIDQNHADGYYKDFGDELNANAAGNTITVGTGAFLVQGRMNVVTESERIVVSAAHAGKKGMVVAHINTFQPDTGEYCVLQTLFDASVSAIEARLKCENTYVTDSDTMNHVYELPLFTFDVGSEGTVLNLAKVIKPIEDYATVKSLYDEILAQYKAHNDEMKKIKDEIVVRQGTIVTSGGKNLLTFNADTKADASAISESIAPALAKKADKTEIEDLKGRLNRLGFREGTFRVPSGKLSEKSFIRRQGNYVIGNFDLEGGQLSVSGQGLIQIPTMHIEIPKEFRPKEESSVNFIACSEGNYDSNDWKSYQPLDVNVGTTIMIWGSKADIPLNISFSFGYEAAPL